MIRAAVLVALILATPAAAQCRLALALALDVSASVDAREYAQQKDGLAAALLRPEVQEALFALPSAHIRLMAYEWSGPSFQRRLAPWKDIRSRADLAAFAAEVRAAKRLSAPPPTALGDAMRHGLEELSKQDCNALTLDVSGDGKANSGVPPRNAQREAQALGVTINALIIGADNPASGDVRFVEIGELSAYFNAYVITGPASFVEVALGFDAYEDAMARKLLRELAPGLIGQVKGQALPRLAARN